MDHAEAVVHAMNEAIERDALSMFLIDTFVVESKKEPRFIAEESLPAHLREILAAIQSRIGAKVWLVDMTSDIDVPSTVAYVPGVPGGYLCGFGTSLSRQYSVYRALTELLETALTDYSLESRVASVGFLAEYPHLQAASGFDVEATVGRCRRFVEFVDTVPPPTPENHLHELRRRLKARGFTPYVSSFTSPVDSVAAVQVYVPGLEHFHLIVNGPSAVVPGERGLAAAGR